MQNTLICNAKQALLPQGNNNKDVILKYTCQLLQFIKLLIVNKYFISFADEWIMCDDDNMTPVSSQDILKLSGGGRLSIWF